MGIRFNFVHANFIGYLLSPTGSPAPRARLPVLVEFLTALSWSGISADYGVTAFDDGALRTTLPSVDSTTLSTDPVWLSGLRQSAAGCLEAVARLPKELAAGDHLLPSRWVEIILFPLRRFFAGYSLSALVLPADFYRFPFAREERAITFFEKAAITSGRYGIFVMPDRAEEPLTILDPFPQLVALAEIPVDPPLVAFWSPNGAACVLPLNEAEDFYNDQLRQVLSEGPTAVSSTIAERDRQIERHRIVHLSDFHFGETRSNLKRRYVQAHLKQTIVKNDLVVLTGDQIDTPKKTYSDEFVEFRDEIQALTDKQIVAIPGNHDVRRAGNRIPFFNPPTYELITDIRSERVVVDHESGCILLSFNSLEKGLFARGSISDDQLLRMAVEFEESTGSGSWET
jgi:predicted phosphodiesterase